MLFNKADVDEDPFGERPWLIWRLISGIFKLVIVLIFFLVIGLCVVYFMSQQEPNFYSAAMKVEDAQSRVLGSKLESLALEIYNSALVPTSWVGELPEAEINGWLAHDLPAKFPELLPANVQDPRVSLADNELTIACRCRYKDLKGILVGKFDLFCTDQPSQVAVRIGDIKFGILPFPVTQFADHITDTLQKSGYPSSWSEMDGDPVLIVDLLDEHLVVEDYYRIVVKSFDIQDEKIVIVGETVEIERQDVVPVAADASSAGG